MLRAPHVTVNGGHRRRCRILAWFDALATLNRNGRPDDEEDQKQAQPVPHEIGHEAMVVAVGTRFDASGSKKGREEGRSSAKIAEAEEADLAESIGQKAPFYKGVSVRRDL